MSGTPNFLIAGSSGMLGTALQIVLPLCGYRFTAPAEAGFDITSQAEVSAQVERFVSQLGSDERGVLINAAAYTNVEAAEDNHDAAFRVNAKGPELLARASLDAGLSLVHVSTDFVFDGTKSTPYAEADEPNPLSVYGQSKLAGENAVRDIAPGALVVRTAWVFGPGGVNFPSKILSIARERGALTVVDDEVGSPTYTVDLAKGIVGLVEQVGSAGVFHIAGSGAVSRYDFACEIVSLAGLKVPVARAAAADFPTVAPRPANSVLDCSRARRLGVQLPAWQDAAARFIESLGVAS